MRGLGSCRLDRLRFSLAVAASAVDCQRRRATTLGRRLSNLEPLMGPNPTCAARIDRTLGHHPSYTIGRTGHVIRRFDRDRLLQAPKIVQQIGGPLNHETAALHGVRVSNWGIGGDPLPANVIESPAASLVHAPAPASPILARHLDGAAGLRHRLQARHQGAQHPHPASARVAAQAAPLREPQAAGNAGMDPAARLPAMPGANLWSAGDHRSRARALGRRLLGRRE
jgi:hypothetical protein